MKPCVASTTKQPAVNSSNKRIMRFSILPNAMALVLIALCVLTASQQRNARSTVLTSKQQSAIAIPTTTQDLGIISDDKILKTSFLVRNIGSRRLVVNEVDAACGCGNPVVDTIIIPPGEWGELNVSLDTRFMNGPVENTASFTTSDPERPRMFLTVRGWVPSSPGVSQSGLAD